MSELPKDFADNAQPTPEEVMTNIERELQAIVIQHLEELRKHIIDTSAAERSNE